MTELSDSAETGRQTGAHGHDEELVLALLNATGQGIYGVDLEGNCTFANPACVTMLGYGSDQELLGKNMHALIHHTRPSGDPYPVEECRIYQAFIESEGTHAGDEIVWRADGTSFPAEYWSYPLFLHSELAGCVVAFVNITERKRAEDALRESEETVLALLNATGQGIYGVDLEGNCTFANPACVTMLGYGSDQELLGKNMHALIHHTRPSGDPYPVEECRIYQAFIESEGTHAGDEIVWRADGTSFPAEYWSYPLFLHSELAGCVVAFVNITERKRAEEELRQTEKLSALGKLSAGLAHELNNPAAAAQRAASQLRERLEELETLSVRLSQQGLDDTSWARLHEAPQSLAAGGDARGLGALERADREDAVASWLDSHGVDDAWQIAPGLVAAGIEDSALDTLANELPETALADALRWMSQSQAIRDLVGTIAASARSISDLVGAVKEHSYMDRAPEQEVNVRDGLESTLRILSHKLKQGVHLVRDFDPELPRIVVLAGELNQVWINLIDNAIDAAGPDGEIRIRTFRENDRIVVEVADNGGGIPTHIQSRIFDPFFTTKDVGQGTGLGLDVARRIVTERCGGEIDFRSEPGDTRFWVRLPLRPPDEHHAGPRPSGTAPTEE